MAIECEARAGQLTVRGLSLGGVQTCLHVPQMDLLFDVGYAPRSLAAVPRLFITHGHGDHCAGLVSLLSNRMLLGLKKPLQVFAPAAICSALTTAVEAFESIQNHPYRWSLTPVQAGDEIDVGKGRTVSVYRSVHVIPCLGYTVWETVRKLKAEFKLLPGPEIARRKHAGDDLFDVVRRPLVSFPGDTTIKVLDQQPHLYESRLLILEATYLDQRRTAAQCRKHGHVHLDEVIERAAHFNNDHVVFTHFSQSYRPLEVSELLAQRIPENFKPQWHALLPETATWPG